jgi:hypothetical protein
MNLFALEVGLIGEPAVFQAYPISAIPHQALAVADASLRFQVVRALAVSDVTGTVMVHLEGGKSSEAAYAGQRLEKVGDSIETQAGAKAVLILDTQAGTIELAPNTLLRIEHMTVSPKGGYQTQLFLERGQVKVKVKKFANPDSSLEIQTPAGVSGVRGTEFGLTVQPSGDTGIGTQEGKVLVTGQGQSVEIPAGYQTLLRLGRTPESVRALINRPQLKLRWLTPTQAGAIRLAGQIDPINLLLVNQVAHPIDALGRFDLLLPIVRPRSPLYATVITPLGQQQRYELAIP